MINWWTDVSRVPLFTASSSTLHFQFTAGIYLPVRITIGTGLGIGRSKLRNASKRFPINSLLFIFSIFFILSDIFCWFITYNGPCWVCSGPNQGCHLNRRGSNIRIVSDNNLLKPLTIPFCRSYPRCNPILLNCFIRNKIGKETATGALSAPAQTAFNRK